jgi:cytochrome c oxidase subunit 2
MLDRLLVWNLAALVAMLVLAHLILLWAVMRSRPACAPANTSLLSSLAKAELFPTLLCCAVFAAMAITSERLWAALRFEGSDPAAMQVEVVGRQFQWYFRYPGDDARFGLTRPQLVNAAAGNPLGLDRRDPAAHDDIVSSVLLLPAGREVDLRLRALDVIHGFFIPGMRLKQNAVPGLELHVHFTPVTPGTYPILCTQVCGSGHARMQAVLRVVPQQEFAAWIAARERKLERPE